MMADDDEKGEVTSEAVDDLLEGDWKEDDDEGDKLFGDEEEAV